MHADASSSNAAHAVNERLAYSVKSAAAVLDVSVRTVWNLINSGAIESFKIGRSRRIARAELEAYVETETRRSAA